MMSFEKEKKKENKTKKHTKKHTHNNNSILSFERRNRFTVVREKKQIYCRSREETTIVLSFERRKSLLQFERRNNFTVGREKKQVYCRLREETSLLQFERRNKFTVGREKKQQVYCRLREETKSMLSFELKRKRVVISLYIYFCGNLIYKLKKRRSYKTTTNKNQSNKQPPNQPPNQPTNQPTNQNKQTTTTITTTKPRQTTVKAYNHKLLKLKLFYVCK